ncbi:unnamed protein product [Prorocentrum cordatum]|uniref:Uncharacterized protein n=1 Tax=Prorocentrum cordatum TaxID=2364126 RepID=A0ABN9SU33_9DINO|nr:unnamed protein product [Polarella glacialis]CAK0856987.1 unnamed protein product [Polarella glacialis]
MHLERCARLFRPQNAIHLNSIMPPVSKPAGLLSIGGTHTELRADDRAGSVLRELAPKPMKQFRESEDLSDTLACAIDIKQDEANHTSVNTYVKTPHSLCCSLGAQTHVFLAF